MENEREILSEVSDMGNGQESESGEEKINEVIDILHSTSDRCRELEDEAERAILGGNKEVNEEKLKEKTQGN